MKNKLYILIPAIMLVSCVSIRETRMKMERDAYTNAGINYLHAAIHEIGLDESLYREYKAESDLNFKKVDSLNLQLLILKLNKYNYKKLK